ncbi:hypothetical protein HZ326_3651 [Fusarium oxysporum f. sp. albedinis]|nr:hypothetical protein HZ326_3651 [Fusarium oxysporum f. sp. albedinis]
MTCRGESHIVMEHGAAIYPFDSRSFKRSIGILLRTDTVVSPLKCRSIYYWSNENMLIVNEVLNFGVNPATSALVYRRWK